MFSAVVGNYESWRTRVIVTPIGAYRLTVWRGGPMSSNSSPSRPAARFYLQHPCGREVYLNSGQCAETLGCDHTAFWRFISDYGNSEVGFVTSSGTLLQQARGSLHV